MKTKNIDHSILICATPEEIYDTLMDGKKHSQFTGDTTKIHAKAGAAFSCYGGYITGITLELCATYFRSWKTFEETMASKAVLL
jgi:hypothetical protein